MLIDTLPPARITEIQSCTRGLTVRLIHDLLLAAGYGQIRLGARAQGKIEEMELRPSIFFTLAQLAGLHKNEYASLYGPATLDASRSLSLLASGGEHATECQRHKLISRSLI